MSPHPVALRERLLRGLDQLGLALPETVVDKLLDYVALLHKWNRAYNLTAVRDPEAMVSRHLLDSLAVIPHLRGNRFADIGTGAGLPGIPLALTRPDWRFTLVDSNGKKIRFVTQAIAELRITNVEAIQCRVEELQPDVRFDGVLSRAFATLADMAQGCSHLLTDDGALFALKGIYPAQELSELPEHYKVDACLPLQVPDADGERHLVIARPGSATAARA